MHIVGIQARNSYRINPDYLPDFSLSKHIMETGTNQPPCDDVLVVNIKEISRSLEHHADAFVFLIVYTHELLTTGKPFAQIEERNLTIF